MAETNQIHVPGLWRCAKCNFTLIQSNLNASTGTVTARDNPGDKCPNCNVPLWRVTEREHRIELQAEIDRVWNKKMDIMERAAAQGTTILRMRLALKMLRAWAVDGNYHATVVFTVKNWIDRGMTGPIPWPESALFAEWAEKEGLSNIDGFVGYRATATLYPTPPPPDRLVE